MTGPEIAPLPQASRVVVYAGDGSVIVEYVVTSAARLAEVVAESQGNGSASAASQSGTGGRFGSATTPNE